MYPVLFQRPRDKAAVTRPTMSRLHEHHHQNIHHHAPVASVGTPMAVHMNPALVATSVNSKAGLGICLGMLGFVVLFGGLMMMSFGFVDSIGLGVFGSIVFILGLALFIGGLVICRRGRVQQLQQMMNQQGGVVTTAYSQPGAQPLIVRPTQPGAPPIIHPQGPGATIVYGPGGQVAYQPQTTIQPPLQQYPATTPYPPQNLSALPPKPDPSSVPTAPPPTYEDAVDWASKTENDVDGQIVV